MPLKMWPWNLWREGGRRGVGAGTGVGQGLVKQQILMRYMGILAFPVLFLNCPLSLAEPEVLGLCPLLRSLFLPSLSWYFPSKKR